MINKSLLREVAAQDGAMAADVIRPFLGEYSDWSLRLHLRALENAGYVALDTHIPGRVLCRITEAGRGQLA